MEMRHIKRFDDQTDAEYALCLFVASWRGSSLEDYIALTECTPSFAVDLFNLANDAWVSYLELLELERVGFCCG